MSYAFSASPGGTDTVSAVVLDAARCWRAARDAGRTVQPCLFATLRAHGAEMLAPVFDSLMSLYESALGRRLRIGEGAVVSEDEHLLLNLLGGSQRACARLERNDGLAVTLRCALCSTRIMMRLALDCGATPTNGSYPG